MKAESATKEKPGIGTEENQLGLIDVAKAVLIEMNEQLRSRNMYAEKPNQLKIIRALECLISRQ